LLISTAKTIASHFCERSIDAFAIPMFSRYHQYCQS
jgi:hypothetical protein